MTVVDARAWTKRNLWRLPSGELCVRPGLRKLYTPDANKRLVGGASVFNSYSGELWHYIFDVSTAVGPKALRVQILDENFDVWQTLTIGADVDPRAITFAVVEGMIVIGSPDFPSLFGLVGSSLRFATKVASVNRSTTAIDMPRGICCQWNNRVVFALDRSLFVSDPIASDGGDPRTYVAQNQNQMPGVIYGLHQGAGGMLVVVTSEGVFGLDSSACAVQVVGNSGTDWRVLNHNAALSFQSSCVVRGRVYGLTRDGWSPIDVESQEEKHLADPVQTFSIAKRVALDDHRIVRMFGGDAGPIVAANDDNLVHCTDMQRDVAAWWSSDYATQNFKLRGLLRDVDGTELWLLENGVFAVAGDFDGDVALTSAANIQPTGALFGTIPGTPVKQRRVTHLTFAGEAGGTAGLLTAAVRGSQKTGKPFIDPNGVQIGTTTWGDVTKRLTTTPAAAIRFDCAAMSADTDDVSVELGVLGALARINPVVDVETIDNMRARAV